MGQGLRLAAPFGRTQAVYSLGIRTRFSSTPETLASGASFRRVGQRMVPKHYDPRVRVFASGVHFFARATSFGSLFNVFLNSPLISIAVCGFVFGVLWIPLFQMLAEHYISKRAALACTLFLAFSPYVFVFTTVSYTESLVLFFTSGAWLLFQKGKRTGASVLVAIAVLSRVTGVLVVLPMLYGSLKQKGKHRIRNLMLSIVPIFALVAWYGYGLFSRGDLLAPVHTTEWAGYTRYRVFFLTTCLRKGFQRFRPYHFKIGPRLSSGQPQLRLQPQFSFPQSSCTK